MLLGRLGLALLLLLLLLLKLTKVRIWLASHGRDARRKSRAVGR